MEVSGTDTNGAYLQRGHSFQQAPCTKRPRGLTRSRRYGAPAVFNVTQGQELQQAIDAASAGDEIVVHTGVYTQPCVIRQADLVLRAAPGAVVKLHCGVAVKAAACITVTAPNWVKIEGVSLRNDVGYGLIIQRSATEVVKCDISGAQGGVLVTRNYDNRTLLPVIRNCTIHGSHKGPGITVKDAHAVLENCEIYANADAGCLATGASSPYLENNTFRDGRGAGVVLAGGCRGVLKTNTVERNTCAGVLVTGGSEPVLLRNTITDNGAAGVRLESGSKGRIEGCVLKGNSGCGIAVLGQSEPTIKLNAFRGGGGRDAVGVVADASSPEILQCTFHSIPGVSIQLCSGGRPLVQGNYFTLQSASKPAVVVGANSSGVIFSNTVALPISALRSGVSPEIVQAAASRGPPPEVAGTVFLPRNDRPFDVFECCPEGLKAHVTSAQDSDSDDADASILHLDQGTASPPLRRRQSSIAMRIAAMEQASAQRRITADPDDDTGDDGGRRKSTVMLQGVDLT
eukprot:Hpha_TRINITY_DN6198_c0_g1::TRINITY_DN6198_c0_g1_i1::g.164889::m.164889/K10297/FBXO11; F-box protein 11